MDRKMLDLYVDYLICSTSYTTATGLSKVTNNAVSHDKITRFLSAREYSNKDLWRVAKPLVRQIESENGVLIIDDTIEEKPYTDQNEYIAYHHDHKNNCHVRGINFVSALYESQGHSVPVGLSLVKKTEEVVKKTGKKSRKDPKSKQERYRELIKNAVSNNIMFKYVLNDTWFSAVENMIFIVVQKGKHFIMPLKNNRKVALSEDDQKNKKFASIGTLNLEKGITVWLQDLPFPVRLVRIIFKNEDGSEGVLHLVTSDLELTDEKISAIYQRRWKVETYHKSLKCNTSLAKSPTKTPCTQANHLFASVCAFIHLERLTIPSMLNHFAIKAKIYMFALRAAFKGLEIFTQTAYRPPAPA
jgi:predicted nucleic acid-binding Zn finger protein